MTRRVLRAFLVSTLFAAAGLPALAAVPPPKLQYDISTLPNGLTVVPVGRSFDADRSPRVWVPRQFEEREPGRTGFAHLFEHMMFKGSEERPVPKSTPP